MEITRYFSLACTRKANVRRLYLLADNLLMKVPRENKAPEGLNHLRGLLRGRCQGSLPYRFLTVTIQRKHVRNNLLIG